MEEKKEYVSPEVTFTRFVASDIILASYTPGEMETPLDPIVIF